MKHIIKTKYRLNRLLLLLSAVLLVSCNEYKEVEERGQFVDHEINLQLPIDIQNAQITEARVVMTNVSSRQEYAVTAFRSEQDKYVANITLPEGTYNLTVNGRCKLSAKQERNKGKGEGKARLCRYSSHIESHQYRSECVCSRGRFRYHRAVLHRHNNPARLHVHRRPIHKNRQQQRHYHVC